MSPKNAKENSPHEDRYDDSDDPNAYNDPDFVYHPIDIGDEFSSSEDLANQ